jgi:serine/threonine protein kinase
VAKALVFESAFDSYKTRSVIGQGGAGTVYEVENSNGATFALKTLTPRNVTKERLKRFQNEIAFCQRQQDSNIVKVLDVGFSGSEVKAPFYVMPLFAGTLRKLMKTLKPENVLQAFNQVLNGVEAAHAVGVWHRDVKPENVLWDDRTGLLVLSDFGIAHFEEEEIYTAVETHVAARMANFMYSAPEQRVRGGIVDKRADIYALGLLLNEMFTGTVPQGSGFKRVAQVGTDFAYVDDLVDWMIQQDPASRPQSIEHVKKELIGRKNEFVALQQLDSAKRRMVPVAQADEFEPLKLISANYDHGALLFELDRNVPAGWAHEFQNPRHGYQFIHGFEPGNFQVRGKTISVGISGRERLASQLTNFVKQYVEAANRGYIEQRRELASQRDRREREALEQEVAEAERKKEILANLKGLI